MLLYIYIYLEEKKLKETHVYIGWQDRRVEE